MDAKFSPGPWEARTGEQAWGDLGLIAEVSDGLDGHEGYFQEIAIANTRLIAAAPDLLQACEDCMENRGDWAAVMGAAIEKARGGK